LGKSARRLDTIAGTVPNPARFPSGCKFHPRCPRMQGDQTCINIEPALREVQKGHWAACHHVEGFAQSPITKPVLDHRREVTAETIVGVADTSREFVK